MLYLPRTRAHREVLPPAGSRPAGGKREASTAVGGRPTRELTRAPDTPGRGPIEDDSNGDSSQQADYPPRGEPPAGLVSSTEAGKGGKASAPGWERCLCEVRVGGVDCTALIDTGAVTTLADQAILEKTEIAAVRSDPQVQLRSASGHTIQVAY